MIGGDGATFFIKATFRTPTRDLKAVNVRQVVSGKNVECDASKFTKIDAGGAVLTCVRKNLGGDTIMITTDFDGDAASTFFVPDTRPRYREVTSDLDLTWCGFPGCAPDMRRQLAWNPVAFLKKSQTDNPISCTVFDLQDLGVLRQGDILRPDQTFPLQVVSTMKGNWRSIHQDTGKSAPLSSRSIQICGTRDEPFDDWPNLDFRVRTPVRYLQQIVY